MAKYDPLTAFLKRHERAEIRMSFQRLEEVLGARLPASARSDRTWWAIPSTGHAIKHTHG
ncbi:DUF7662 domain-containing protein [Micromonospora coerulea]|uniref:DUF7662 domain-containing protein n=1 Tax=Micromonospora coerulea TaxID=47856 RepID=UPI003FD8187A